MLTTTQQGGSVPKRLGGGAALPHPAGANPQAGESHPERHDETIAVQRGKAVMYFTPHLKGR
jgi:hypothetical protein